MNNFGTMYVFELKKISKRKIVLITMVIMLVISCCMGMMEAFSNYTYTDSWSGEVVEFSGYEAIQMHKSNALTISGELIDDALLGEVKESYRGVYYEGDASVDGLSGETSVRMIEGESLLDAEERIKERERLKNIYQYVRRVVGDYNAIHVISAADLYQERMDYIQEEMTYQKLTEGERMYWKAEEESISKPFTYGYADGWKLIIGELYSLNIMLLLAIAICLSTVFSEEHVRKTDQLILCSKYGKRTLYIAKILAGVTFGLSSAVVMFLASLIPTLLIYGTEGFDVALQIYAPMASWNISMGQAVLLMAGIYFVAAVFYSIIAMFLSEALKNSVAVMGLMTGGMILTLFLNIPSKYRILSQIYELLPTLIMGLWEFTDCRLVKIFGMYFTNLQIAPILYMLCSVILVFLGKKVYKNYQVSGR